MVRLSFNLALSVSFKEVGLLNALVGRSNLLGGRSNSVGGRSNSQGVRCNPLVGRQDVGLTNWVGLIH